MEKEKLLDEIWGLMANITTCGPDASNGEYKGDGFHLYGWEDCDGPFFQLDRGEKGSLRLEERDLPDEWDESIMDYVPQEGTYILDIQVHDDSPQDLNEIYKFLTKIWNDEK